MIEIRAFRLANTLDNGNQTTTNQLRVVQSGTYCVRVWCVSLHEFVWPREWQEAELGVQPMDIGCCQGNTPHALQPWMTTSSGIPRAQYDSFGRYWCITEKSSSDACVEMRSSVMCLST